MSDITIKVSIESFINSDLIPHIIDKDRWVRLETGEYISPKLYAIRLSLHCFRGLKWLKENGFYNEYAA